MRITPNKEFPWFDACRESISLALVNRGRELQTDLNDSTDETLEILVNVLAQNLDERFSVTNRKKMELLQ